MGNAADFIGFPSSPDGATGADSEASSALWHGKSSWAPPAGFVDYTPCINRITANLRPDLNAARLRIAAKAGTPIEETLQAAILALGLTAKGEQLDIAALAQRLTTNVTPAGLAGIETLARLGLLNLAVRVEGSASSGDFEESAAVDSLSSRQSNLPLSPARPTLAHVLAQSGVDEPGHAEATSLVARFNLLRNAGLDLDARSVNGRSPLQLAVLSKNQFALDALIAAGANVNATDRWNSTPLMLALRGRFESGVKSLIAKGALMEVAAEQAVAVATTQTLASHASTATIIRARTESSAQNDPQSAQRQALALHSVAIKGHTDAGQALAKAGALRHAPVAGLDGYDDNLTPLMVAAAAGHAHTIKTLIAAGADADLRAGPRQQTALHVAARSDKPEAVEALVRAGANLNTRDAEGFTALHLAAALGKLRVTQALIKAGASLSATALCGRRPVDVAAQAGNTFIFEALLRASAPRYQGIAGGHEDSNAA